MKKVLFIDRDGTLVIEPQDNYQVDSLEKLEYFPLVFQNLCSIANHLDYELVMVSNQDGLGSESYPSKTFELVQERIMKAFSNEGIIFQEVLIDPSREEDNSPNRKPRTGMVQEYISGDYDLEHSYVIGDRITDIEFAKNIGCKGILLHEQNKIQELEAQGLMDYCALMSDNWTEIRNYLFKDNRSGKISRVTKETNIAIEVFLDGTGLAEISTGIGFFDHMLEQISRHSGCNLKIITEGDLDVDKHHTIEDTAIALGEAFNKALGDKIGIERYGFVLPMDDALAQVAIDFGGRCWLEWNADFKREKIGEMPTEMFMHFFKSFCDGAKCNLNIKAQGNNEHHKIEAIFKSLGRAIKMAVKKDRTNYKLPSTKEML
jgi:imidazoleglycerol-phosphate dehydratase/histidinol-phosphatase